MPKTRHHLYPRRDLIRSVLLGEPVKTQCGISRNVTREEIDGVTPENVNPCRDCHKFAATSPDGYSVNAPNGWTALLEKELLEAFAENDSRRTVKWTVSHLGTWKY